MCFKVNEKIPVLKSGRGYELEVFKEVVFSFDEDYVEIVSPYYNHLWYKGDIEEIPEVITARQVAVNFDGDLVFKGSKYVKYGYHSYTNPFACVLETYTLSEIKDLITFKQNFEVEVVLNGIIPSGSLYRTNETGHAVSDRLTIYTESIVVATYPDKQTLKLESISLWELMKERIRNLNRSNI